MVRRVYYKIRQTSILQRAALWTDRSMDRCPQFLWWTCTWVTAVLGGLVQIAVDVSVRRGIAYCNTRFPINHDNVTITCHRFTLCPSSSVTNGSYHDASPGRLGNRPLYRGWQQRPQKQERGGASHARTPLANQAILTPYLHYSQDQRPDLRFMA